MLVKVWWTHKQTKKTDKLFCFMRLRKASVGVLDNRHFMYVTTLGYLHHTYLHQYLHQLN